MLVRDVMARFPACIHLGADIRRAAELVSISQVSELMVLDHDDEFVGALSEGDLIRAVLPTYDESMRAGGSLNDAFGDLARKARDLAGRPIDPLVVRNAITLRPTDEVARAAVVMTEKQIRRLPVVEGRKLEGTVARSDICRAVIYHA
ncbi:HPP family protein [Cryptosporangium sp. NPDC051539]|uniref:HPP family protein n=1 Tax=Cryptosporangium sp. NPDC051539 TaxID=3363962 RepID=UPI00378FC873